MARGDRESSENEAVGVTPPPPRRVEIQGRIIWQAIGATLLTVGLIWAVRQASGLVAMILISFFFSLALVPGVNWFVGRYGWRRGAAVGVIYLLGAVFVVLMLAVLLPAFGQLAQEIGEHGAQWVANLQGWVGDTLGLDIGDSGDIAGAADETGRVLLSFFDNPFGQVVGIAVHGVGLVFSVATIAMFTFYFTADGPRIQRATLRLFTPETQERIGWTWDQAIIQTGGYFYSRLLLMLINGLGFFFTMALVGIDIVFALALAVFAAFVSEFIPVVGTYIGGAVPVVLAIALQGLVAGAIVLAYVLIYQQVENLWLSPKLSGKTMALGGGLAFGAALAGGAIAGPMGAFTALPVAALISSFVSNYIASHEVVYGSGDVDCVPVETRDGTATQDAEGDSAPDHR